MDVSFNFLKGCKIQHLPQILTISLLRFNFNFDKMERYKVGFCVHDVYQCMSHRIQ